MEFKLRKKILPKTLADFGAFTFLIAVIPIIYWFEIFIVLPAMHPMWSFWHLFHTICGTFLMINITSNFVAAVLVDTSIQGRMLTGDKEGWHLCSTCEAIVPPRSWHCNDCGVCILKREHHCLFTACCIGHYNYRYFFIFLIDLAIATAYSTYFNSYFLWDSFGSFSIYTIIKLAFPLAVFLFDSSINQFYLMLYVINIAGIFFSGALLGYHILLMKNGQVTYENAHNIEKYNLGWRQNIEEVLGKRWYLVWVFPSIKSELPHDGIHWHSHKEWMQEGGKHR